MIQLRNYQINAIERLKNTSEGLLRSSENEICIFQAPTGSGKTIMVAEFLKQLAKNRQDERKFSFIWISVRRLHDQSKDKLEKYYEDDRSLTCSYFEDLEDKKIGENEILFINWQSINKKDINVYIRDNEEDNNLNSIIAHTKEEGRDVILIIDESHHTASSDKSKELIEIISPKLTIEVSATPHLKDSVSGIVKVNLSDVKEEEMIKSEIAVNPEFMNLKIGSKSTDEIVIEQALKKREEIIKMFESEEANVNPLVLIQLPDKKEGLEDKKESILAILKEKFKITEDNGKLAVWLSEEKSENLPNIEKNDNETEVLIFKQAIALGWDCPRASILVIFRESKSFTFTIQTIGRIMRMSELRYYKQEDLNKGFVFTNLANVEITEDYAKDYVTVYESKRSDKDYNEVHLHSIYLKRQRERTRLSGEFVKIFKKLSEKKDLPTKITLDPSIIVKPIMADGKIVDLDKTGEIEQKGTIDVKLTDREAFRRFDEFIVGSCSPFAPRDSSDRMKTAIYQFFKDNFKIEKFDPRVHRIVMGKENVQAFIDMINIVKEEYTTKVVNKTREQREIQDIDDWEVPIIISYNSKYKQENYSRSIMQPLYLRKPSEPEKNFMHSLNHSEKVKWWFRNGESEVKYFAVYYIDENGIGRAFYVDFIVMFKDGSVSLFDTKSGTTAKEAGPRSDGLQKYISQQKSNGRKIWGGIVIDSGGTWRYFDKEDYKYDPKDLSSWKILEL